MGALDALIFGIRDIFVGSTQLATRSKLRFSATDFVATDNAIDGVTDVGIVGAAGQTELQWAPTAYPNGESKSFQRTFDTTNDTEQTMLSIPVADETFVDVYATVIGRSANNQAFRLDLRGAWKRADGAIVQVDAPSTSAAPSSGNPAGWTAVLSLDGNNVRVRVKGPASTTVRWHVLADTQVVELDANGILDPATLSLTWYYDAIAGAYNGTTWTSIASAGSSGGRTLVAGTAPPATGGAPDFDGSTHFLIAGSSLKYDSLITGSAYFIQAVFVADTFAAYGGAGPNDEMLIGDDGGNIYIGVSTSGLQFGHYDGVSFKTTADAGGAGAGFIAISSGTKYCVQAWYDGTNLNCRVNNGAVKQVAAANLSNLNLMTPRVGKNYTSSFFDGREYQLITMASVPNSTTRDDLLAAAQAVHGF
jgi:hypothetical protein